MATIEQFYDILNHAFIVSVSSWKPSPQLCPDVGIPRTLPVESPRSADVKWATLTVPPIVAATAVLLYDYAVTLRMEVDLIWLRKWNFMTVIYILQRYLPFMDTFIVPIIQCASPPALLTVSSSSSLL